MNLYKAQLYQPSLMARRTLIWQRVAMTEIKYTPALTVLAPKYFWEQFRLHAPRIEKNKAVRLPKYVISQSRPEFFLPGASLISNPAQKNQRI